MERGRKDLRGGEERGKGGGDGVVDIAAAASGQFGLNPALLLLLPFNSY